MQEAALFTAAGVVYFVTVTFFPGYPPGDAEGFIRNGAAGAKYIGARKAYAVYNQEALPAFGRFVTAYRAVPAAMPCSYSTVPAAFRPLSLDWARCYLSACRNRRTGYLLPLRDSGNSIRNSAHSYRNYRTAARYLSSSHSAPGQGLYKRSWR